MSATGESLVRTERTRRLLADALAAIGASQDYQEGIAAFLEKRPARWTGR
jgi:enoyl-CoA hydratase/carnithine racemase